MLAVAVILAIPLIAMRFTDEVEWRPFDFFVMGFILLGAGLVCESIIRKVTKIEYRIALCAATLASLVLIWELAVGVFGTPFAGS